MNEPNQEDVFWQDYEKLPDSLKEALFSDENYNIVNSICEKYGITDENVKNQIVKYVGKVLMGLLPTKEFAIMIELDLNLDSERAREIALDIDIQIFSHLRIDLNKLYMEKEGVPQGPVPVADKKEMGDNKEKMVSAETPKQNTEKTEKEKPAEPSETATPATNKDLYRESII